MNNIIKVSRFLLYTFVSQTIICFSIIILNIVLSIAVTQVKQVDGSVGSVDSIAIIWAFILGLTNLKYSLKFMLTCGISRKMYFISMSITILITSIVWAALSVLFSKIGILLASVNIIYEVIYRNSSIGGALVWNFGIILFMLALGTLITLIYYRSGKKMKLLVTAVPFVLYGILIFFNFVLNGVLFKELGAFFIKIMGFSSTVPNPYISALSFIILSIIFSGGIYLLLRKAPYKT